MTPDHPCCPPARAGTDLDVVVPASVASPATGVAVRDEVAADLVALPGGMFRMGSDDAVAVPGDGEGPVRPVTVAPFRISRHAVSNARFGAFVEATGYATEAERFGWSFVFHLFVPTRGVTLRGSARGTGWWLAVDGAHWRAPEGPGSNVADRFDHPAVHLSWNDATAYCAWSGTRLPTEAEWEYAARGGLDQARYPWGDELMPGGSHRCNIWQGRFPERNTRADGWVGTAPVGTYAANGFGLYNTVGNVWEWCADRWSPGPHPAVGVTDPAGMDARVMRGGSYLCHKSYCLRYRVSARSSNTPDSGTGNMGFRVAADIT